MSFGTGSSFLGLNIADYIIVGIILISMLISFVRGFVKELTSLVVWLLGAWIALKLYYKAAEILAPYITNHTTRHIVGFSGIFLFVILFGILCNYLLGLVINKTGLSGTDRVLGMVFGALRGIILMAVIVLLISSTAFVQDEWWTKSFLIPYLQIVVDWLKSCFPESLTDIAKVLV
jgi:membrane protein required for colicin V production